MVRSICTFGLDRRKETSVKKLLVALAALVGSIAMLAGTAAADVTACHSVNVSVTVNGESQSFSDAACNTVPPQG